VAFFAAGGTVGRPSATVPSAADPVASESRERASEHETIFEMHMVMTSGRRGEGPRDH
jgi:hypothetical protein